MIEKWKKLTPTKQMIWMVAILIVFIVLSQNARHVANLLRNAMTVFAPFLVGAFIAYFLARPVDKFRNIYQKSSLAFVQKRKHILSVITVFLLLLALLTLIVSFVTPVVTRNLVDLIGSFEGQDGAMIAWLNELEYGHFLYGLANNLPATPTELIQMITDNEQATTIDAPGILGMVANWLGTIFINVMNVTTSVFNFVMGLIVAFYLLVYQASVIKLARRIATVSMNEEKLSFLTKYLKKCNDIFYKFISAQFLAACILGTLATILLAIIGIDYAVTFGLLLGIFNMIPFFGSIVAILLTTFVTIFTGGPQQAVIVFVALIILQQIDANIINPKITGDALGLNPLLVIASILIGGSIWGIFGMFIGVPIAAILKVLLMDFLKTREEKLKTRRKATSLL